jgi:hypothetical protein
MTGACRMLIRAWGLSALRISCGVGLWAGHVLGFGLVPDLPDQCASQSCRSRCTVKAYGRPHCWLIEELVTAY